MNSADYALIVVAAIGALGALVTAFLTARYGRLARVERRLAAVETMNNRLWAYIRRQHDHAYRSGIVPLDIPDNLWEPTGDTEK